MIEKIQHYLTFRIGLFALALTMALSVAPAAGAVNLTYSSYLPPSHAINGGMRLFIDIVEKKSGGDVQLQLYASGSVAAADTTLTAIKNGLIDGGFIVPSYFPTSVPVNAILSELPFYISSNAVSAAAATDYILNDCPRCLQEYKAKNVHFLSTYSTPPYHAMCAADMADGFDPNGLRMRVPGEAMAKWVTKIGGIPVRIPNSQAYQAMQRGMLDCVIGAVAWLKTLSLAEVVNSVVTMPMGGFQGGSVFNISVDDWQQLDEGTQNMIQTAALRGTAAVVYGYTADEREARELAHEKGVNFVEVPKLKPARQAFMQKQAEYAAKTASSRGVKNSDEIIQGFLQKLDKWQDLLEGKDLTEQQYYQLLVKEIL